MRNQTLQLNRLRERLTASPEETTVSFPYKIREVIKEFKDSVALFSLIYANESEILNIRFKAFYSHLVILRQQKDNIQYRHVLDTYSSVFQSFKLFNALLGQYYQSKTKNKYNLMIAVQYAEKAILDLPSSPNVLHLFVELVADYHDYSDQIDKELLTKAEREVDKAIAISNGTYAKYYASKARILAFQMKFREAKDNIQLAIELEPSTSTDYPIRIGDYQTVKNNISYIEYSLKMEAKQIEAMKSFDEVRNKVVELLGLLSAIIAFTIGSVQILKDMPFQNAAKLLIVLGGTCVTVFAIFSVTFFGSRVTIYQYMAIVLGFAMIALGLLL